MSINKEDWFEEAKRKIDEAAKSGELQRYFKEIIEKEKQRKEYVNNKKFFEWLTNFVQKLREMKCTYSTESFLYMDKDNFTKEDMENENYIGSPIFDLFEEIGKEQGLEVVEDDTWDFPDREWNFKFNNKMYFICELIGQGTEYIVRTDSNKVKEYIDLDLYFEKNFSK